MEPEFLAEGFEGKGPGALVAYRGGQPVAYLPHMLRRINFRVPVGPTSLGRFQCRQLVLYGYASNEENHTPILEMFFKSLLKHDVEWHVAQAFDLAMHTPLAEHVSRMSLSNRSHGAVGKLFDTLQVDLSETFEQYLADRFSKKIRYNLKREVRLLQEADPGRVVTRVYTSPDEVADFLHNAERIAQRTYQWKLGFPTVDASIRFLRRLECMARHEKMRSYILFIRDVPAAYCLGSIRWGEFSYDVVGYEPKFAKLNPGKVLLYNILDDLHCRRVVDRIDFGKGITDYKRLFATSGRQSLDVSFYAPGFYPRLLRLLSAVADSGYRWLHPLIKPLMPYIKHKVQGVTAALAAPFSGFDFFELYQISQGFFD
jgi:GNAT acetyltransferase-like protein